MNDLTFAAGVLAGPVAFLAVTAPRMFDPPPPGLAGWSPHIVVGLLVLFGLARWFNQGSKE